MTHAIKFTEPGGEVGINFAARTGKAGVEISVWDTGIGIAPAALNQLFKPFVQIDSGLNRRHEGTGLGLALVYRMVQSHRGSIGVRSIEGEGSTFSVNFPFSVLDRSTADGSEGLQIARSMTTARERTRIDCE